jgi:DNA-binding IclR family transcriptional regulator
MRTSGATRVGFGSTYERGRALPLLQSAASRIVLTYLPPARLARQFAQQPEEFAAADLDASLEEVRAVLKPIRSEGYDITSEQVTPGVTGIAAPLFDAQRNVLGSLSLTLQSNTLTAGEVERVAGRIVFGARIVGNVITQ